MTEASITTLDDIIHRWNVVHGFQQHRFQNRTQTARTGFTLHRFFSNRLQTVFAEIDFDIFHFEQFRILLGQRIFRIGQNADQRLEYRALQASQ